MHNFYLYTNFHNYGLLVEKIDGESNRKLQAALGNPREGFQSVSKCRAHVSLWLMWPITGKAG